MYTKNGSNRLVDPGSDPWAARFGRVSLKEYRKYDRLNAPIGIAYGAAHKKKREEKARSVVRNISGGGVCFIVKEELRCGDLLELELEIPYLTEPISTFGEVVWISRLVSSEGAIYDAGVCFRDLKAKDLHAILEYVHSVGIG